MVKIMEHPIKMDDLGVPLFLVQHPFCLLGAGSTLRMFFGLWNQGTLDFGDEKIHGEICSS